MVRAERPILSVILAAYLGLALWYGVVTPILEPYDEPKHFGFVLSLALDHGLPVQDPTQFQPWGNEGSQPPLYYLAAAAATGWTDRPGYLQSLAFNPYTTLFAPGEPNDNRNLFLHHRNEDFPYHDNVLGIHIARVLSALIGATALLATYLTARQFFPAQPVIVLGATAFQAFIPSFIYVNSAVSNDGLVIALASFALYFCVRLARSSQVTARSALLLGALIGLATLTKLSALPLLGVGALALSLPRVALGRSWLASAAFRCLLMLSAFLAVSGWWFWRNWILYSELLGTQTMNRIAGLRPQAPTLTELAAELPQIERTFWAAFGTGNVHPEPIWLLLPRALTILGLIGCGCALIRSYLENKQKPPRPPERPWHSWLNGSADVRATGVCLAWVAACTAALGWWLYAVLAVSGRLLFPALPPLVLAVVFGINYLTPRRLRIAAITVSSAGMLTLAALMPITVIVPAFAPPPVVSAAQLTPAVIQTDISFDGYFRLLGYALPEPTTVLAQPLHLELYWQALLHPPADYAEFAQLISPGGEVIAELETVPGRGSFPTSDWTAGKIYRDTLSLYPRTALSVPVAARLVLGWRQERQPLGFPLQPRDGKRFSQHEVGRLRLAPSRPSVFRPSHSLAANFGDQIDLDGFDLAAETLTLYWHARANITIDYTVFVHALDAEGRIMAQADNQPRQGAYPTSFWQPGELIQDVYPLSLPANVAQLRVGLYQQQTGQRLPVMGQSADSVLLR